jgi:hypothetical protein
MSNAHLTHDEIVNMFVDRTAGEESNQNRLITRETDSGNVALIGHGWVKLAEYDESRGVVTVFTGHKSINSQTTSRHLNKVVEIAEQRGRDVVLSGESPVWDTPTNATNYINNYVNFSAGRSAVERDAVADVMNALSHLS